MQFQIRRASKSWRVFSNTKYTTVTKEKDGPNRLCVAALTYLYGLSKILRAFFRGGTLNRFEQVGDDDANHQSHETGDAHKRQP